ncbi:alpha/beta fold hydrolase [Jiangella aurantiaca]|uniref:alpha/beta fold hydrolase n=1 Tax=Jiangella aurantiaca TaxID=2530373 RepID=UPI0013A5EE9C|nr:alpha/beta hydrolase [Jiangella aurantiaca]
MTPILFLSGAGLRTWIWDDVRAALEVETRVAGRPGADAGLDEYADAALRTAEGWASFRVVAHSIGGVVASALVARAPERVSGVVAVCASVPEVGSSFIGALPVPQRYVMGLVTRVLGTRPPDSAIRKGLAARLEPELASRIVADFAPESKALYRDRVPERRFPASSTYILTERDSEYPAALQERYAARLGGDVVRLATGHLPMLEDPARLTEVIGRQ